jgi:hypothetical protein
VLVSPPLVFAQCALEAAPAGEDVVQRRRAELGVAKRVLDAVGGDEVLVVAGVSDERLAGDVGLAEVPPDGRTQESLLALGVADALGEGRGDLERLEEGRLARPNHPAARADAPRLSRISPTHQAHRAARGRSPAST